MNAGGATVGVVAGKIGRGRRAWSQLWQVPTFFVGLVALLGVAASSPFRAEMREGPFAVDLRSLREALRSNQDLDNYVQLAERLLDDVRRHPRREGETFFLAGSIHYRLAEAATAYGPHHAKALEYLERAIASSVADADAPALHHRLGVMLYRSGRDPHRAVQLMAEGIEQGADDPRQAYGLLLQAYAKLPSPDIEAALAASQKIIELTDDPDALGQARCLRAELLLRQGHRLDALKELDRISGKISRELRVRTRLLQAQTAEQEGLFHRGADIWKELLADAADVPGGRGRVLLAYGHCRVNADPPNLASAVQAWQEALSIGGSAGQAAGLRLGDLQLNMNPGQTAAPLAAWSQALSAVRSVSDYQNNYLEVAKARDIFERACRQFLERREFLSAQQAAELYKKLAAPGVAEEHWARALEGQGREQQKRAGADKAKLEQAHGLFHRAAVAYEEAALKRPEREQIDLGWRSAQSYLAAHDLAHAAAALERFVTLAKDDPRLAQAWFALADAQENLGKKELARQAYYKCIEYPETPFAWRARYQLAVDEIERKNFADAKKILKQNLTVTGPTMEREAHEKSIYKMAGLLLQMQAYDEAVWYLQEASRRYPNNAKALDARDRLADCYRLLAQQTQSKIQELQSIKRDNLLPERKAALDQMKAHQQRTRREWLNQAIAVYNGLADELLGKTTKKLLGQDEAFLLRKALFSTAEVYFELNDFMSALTRYQKLQQDYAGQVESLHACHAIWRCVGVMIESPEQIRLARAAAKESAKIARAALDKMSADLPGFHGRGAWTRENWLTWIDWVNLQLNPPSAAPQKLNPLAN